MRQHEAATRGLAWTLTIRLAITMILVMALQAAVFSVRDYLKETDFFNAYIRREAHNIARGLRSRQGTIFAEVQPSQYQGEHAASYAFRVIELDGRVVAEHNGDRLAPLAPWFDRPSRRQDIWVRRLDAEERMHLAGGLKIYTENRDLWVEIATFGDPANTYLRNIAQDILDDVWVPALPLMLLSMLVAVTSVRRSLRPLVQAANRADEISVLERGERLDASKLPAEAAHFALAINRLLDRVTDLVGAHRLFVARAAHELRTPLSIMMLEVANLKDPGSRRLEADLTQMSEIVDQLLTLSRLTTDRPTPMEPVDISTMTRELIARLMRWAEKDGHRLSFASRREAPIVGNEATLRDAVRNLVENAVRHTPPGTHINVEVDEQASVIVEDSGPGLGNQPPEQLLQPFRKGSGSAGGAGLGLAIVQQAAEVHGGRLEIGTSTLGGARFVLHLPGTPPERVSDPATVAEVRKLPLARPAG